MISYAKLWRTMKRKGVSQYKLIHEHGFSTGQLDRLRKNENINVYTLNSLCKVLDCAIEDIITYIPDPED